MFKRFSQHRGGGIGGGWIGGYTVAPPPFSRHWLFIILIATKKIYYSALMVTVK
jgi:hypothetical protein